jgi:CBS domain-containing protein
VLAGDERLVGIVTEADLLRGRYADAESADAPVREVMTTPVYGMDCGAPAALLARVMLGDRVRCIPIVEGARVVGVVTRRDLVRALARDDLSIAADIRRRLAAYGAHHRWSVTVHDGQATVGGADAADQARVVMALVEAVPGVVGSRVLVGPHPGSTL